MEKAGYLLLKRIHIENANAISSPITYGFPAVTGFLGAVHALSRRLHVVASAQKLALDGVLIACHDCRPQVYRQTPYSDYSFNQSRNPLLKSGKTASIVEEGKCHLSLSLGMELLAEKPICKDQGAQLALQVQEMLMQQRIAGGSVRGFGGHGFYRRESAHFFLPNDAWQMTKHLVPAFILMEAKKDLEALTAELQKNQPEATALDALIDLACLHHIPVEKNGSIGWQTRSAKTGRGWLVPMPLGYQGIAPAFAAGALANCRTDEYPAQYVESVYGLGKWVFPHRIDDITKAFWRYQHQAENDLYCVTQEER
ncbi:MAG: type I-F CRISPR-associated protein Csy2 [bacterium]|nr:type I-F CRISPR-associated protein Csy2 [bacterium]